MTQTFLSEDLREYALAEVWRVVPSVPFVEASSWGRVRRLPRLCPMPRQAPVLRGGVPTYGNMIAKEKRFIWSTKDPATGKMRNFKVARLICEAFHGLPPEGKPYCLHGNEVGFDNRPGNLSWGTQKENLNASWFLKQRSQLSRLQP